MAVARDKPIKQGHLLIPPLLKKKWQKKYCVLYTFSTHGVERLEIYDSEEDATKRSCSKFILLENCLKISFEPQKNQPHAFSIITKNDRFVFAGVNSDDSTEWVGALQGVAFRDTFSSTTIEEDNELYCPSGDEIDEGTVPEATVTLRGAPSHTTAAIPILVPRHDSTHKFDFAAGVFRVLLVNTEASQRCGLHPGDYTLVVAAEELQIRNSDTQNLLFTWPYRFIRRYGHKRGRFNFEAGRKCASGEGSFDLEHNNAQEIFKCMTSKMDSMKQRLGNNNNSNNNQDKVSAVTNTISTMTNTMSTATVTSTLRSAASNSSISTFLSFGSPDGGLGLPVDDDEGLDAARTMSPRSRSPLVSVAAPMKPPRKNPPAPVPRYDKVELRTDAWRTLGSDTIHSERHTDRSVTTEHPSTTRVFHKVTHDSTHSDYDKLDHFGSTPKLDDEDPSYSTIHRTDTSYRKVRSPGHRVYNDFEYTPVVKHHHQPSHIV